MRRMLSLLLLVSLFAVPAFAVGPVVGSTCKFEWTEPQTNTNGSNVTDLAEYRLYISQTAGSYGSTPAKIIPAPLADPAAASVLQTACPAGIPEGQSYAVMTAVDVAGNASVFSNEAPFVFDTVSPGSPVQLTPKK